VKEMPGLEKMMNVYRAFTNNDSSADEDIMEMLGNVVATVDADGNTMVDWRDPSNRPRKKKVDRPVDGWGDMRNDDDFTLPD
jgi:hypothetical protein